MSIGYDNINFDTYYNTFNSQPAKPDCNKMLDILNKKIEPLLKKIEDESNEYDDTELSTSTQLIGGNKKYYDKFIKYNNKINKLIH